MQNLYELRTYHKCSRCEGDYYSLGETNIKSLCPKCVTKASDKPQEIVIKAELLDTSKLQGDNSKVLWRPSNFDGYIGQSALKEILQGYINGCKAMQKTFPHFLIDGRAGSGKTTIAYILANQLGLNFKECVANTLKSPQQFIDKLVEVDGGILFLDEIQVINKQVANFMLPILEDFQINGQHIKPFTMFGATTEMGVLLKKFKPLVDRFKIQKTLEAYTVEELTTLIKQYKNKSFTNIEINDNIFIEIAKNARGTPRIAIRLLESLVFINKPIANILKIYGIVKDGITEGDIKILTLLLEKEKGLGLTSLCAYLQTSVENYVYQIESYLIEQGMITIGSRRTITNKGKEFLNSLKEA